MTSVRKARKKLDRWYRYCGRYGTVFMGSPRGLGRAYQRWVDAEYAGPKGRLRAQRDAEWLEEVGRRVAEWLNG